MTENFFDMSNLYDWGLLTQDDCPDCGAPTLVGSVYAGSGKEQLRLDAMPLRVWEQAIGPPCAFLRKIGPNPVYAEHACPIEI